MKEDDERFKKHCGDRGTVGCFAIPSFEGGDEQLEVWR